MSNIRTKLSTVISNLEDVSRSVDLENFDSTKEGIKFLCPSLKKEGSALFGSLLLFTSQIIPDVEIVKAVYADSSTTQSTLKQKIVEEEFYTIHESKRVQEKIKNKSHLDTIDAEEILAERAAIAEYSKNMRRFIRSRERKIRFDF